MFPGPPHTAWKRRIGCGAKAIPQKLTFKKLLYFSIFFKNISTPMCSNNCSRYFAFLQKIYVSEDNRLKLE
jgi:hypothetical protein